MSLKQPTLGQRLAIGAGGLAAIVMAAAACGGERDTEVRIHDSDGYASNMNDFARTTISEPKCGVNDIAFVVQPYCTADGDMRNYFSVEFSEPVVPVVEKDGKMVPGWAYSVVAPSNEKNVLKPRFVMRRTKVLDGNYIVSDALEPPRGTKGKKFAVMIEVSNEVPLPETTVNIPVDKGGTFNVYLPPVPAGHHLFAAGRDGSSYSANMPLRNERWEKRILNAPISLQDLMHPANLARAAPAPKAMR